MAVQQEDFGTMPDGTSVKRFTLTNANGLTVRLTNYGARITEVHAPDKDGRLASVVLGFDDLDQYLKIPNFFGCTVGRYANRLAEGEFVLDGRKYAVSRNQGNNTLHGGQQGFDKAVWKAEVRGDSVHMTHRSPDGDMGFPGNLDVSVTFSFNDRNELVLEYEAATDKPTIINLTDHSYFNLAGAGNGTILDHILTLAADHYTPVDEEMIPSGQIASVHGTIMDFTSPKPIGERIAQVSGGGYDHNYVLRGSGGSSPAVAAHVVDPKTRRFLEVHTTQPGVQLYTSIHLDGTIQGIGGRYEKYGALCLETQRFPDSPHHPNFPSAVLRPGEVYRETTVYMFGVE